MNDEAVIKKAEQEMNATLRDNDERRSATALLIDLVQASGAHVYLDEQGDPYISFSEKPLISFPIHGPVFHRWLSAKFWNQYEKGYNTECFNQVISTLEGQAFHENVKQHLFNRIARYDGIIYYDLGDDQRVVRIDREGWKIVTSCPVKFRRFKHQKPQVTPQEGGDIRRVLQYINLRQDKDKLLFLTYLVAVLVPDIPRVILVHVGSQGAAKSTAMRVVRSLIDPSYSDLLSPPADTNELGQLANHNYCLYFDNLSRISDDLSDILCRLATGIGFSKRKLYSDDEDILYNQKVAIGFNGVTLVAHKADVLDRCLILGSWERIPDNQRLEENELLQNFDKEKPFILGALFTVLSETLRISPDVKLPKRPRMADYARYAASAAISLGESVDAFLSAFEENTIRQNQATIESSPVAQTILDFMNDKSEWIGTSSDLYGLLKKSADKVQLDGFPKGVNWLWRKIEVVRPNLQSMGVSVAQGEKSFGSIIQIFKDTKGDKNTAIGTPAAIEGNTTTSSIDDLNGSMAVMAASENEKTSCPICRNIEFWQRADGTKICSVCHPNSTEMGKTYVTSRSD